jgi:hypothetical protein
VRYANAAGTERVVSIVGTDEVDLNRNHISWVSPLGRALMKSAAGDRVVLQAPGGTEYLTVLEVCYERISVEPFREPPGAEASAKGLPRRLIHSLGYCARDHSKVWFASSGSLPAFPSGAHVHISCCPLVMDMA